MALDFAPPRYAQLVAAIQDRISSGAYAPGALMPTEAQLGAEFGVSRATVVRALQLLKAEGWVESRQGRGTFVRGEPAGTEPVRRGADLFVQAEAAGDASELVQVGPAVPPPAVAVVLGVEPGSRALQRQRVVRVDGEPAELVSAWFPLPIAEGTGLDSDRPLAEGTRDHLARRKRLAVERVTERITARRATAEEVRLLALPKRVPVLALLVVGHTGGGEPVVAVTLALPGDRHELEDTYPI